MRLALDFELFYPCDFASKTRGRKRNRLRRPSRSQTRIPAIFQQEERPLPIERC